MQRVIFALLPEVEVLDLAGPVQAFHEANRYGAGYEVHTCAAEPRVRTDQGLWLSDLEPLPEVGPEDLVVVPGARMDVLQRIDPAFLRWLRRAHEGGAQGVSIQEYRTRLRLERARDLLRDPGLTVEAVAARCGFESARQLRRGWKEAFGTAPSAGRPIPPPPPSVRQ